MAESRQYVRVLLYGCAHKPKFSAMAPPKKGDTITCYACRRGRLVTGIETGWKYASAACRRCKWKFASETAGKKRLYARARAHADAYTHHVCVTHDGYEEIVKPADSRQLQLIDDLQLPEPVIKP